MVYWIVVVHMLLRSVAGWKMPVLVEEFCAKVDKKITKKVTLIFCIIILLLLQLNVFISNWSISEFVSKTLLRILDIIVFYGKRSAVCFCWKAFLRFFFSLILLDMEMMILTQKNRGNWEREVKSLTSSGASHRTSNLWYGQGWRIKRVNNYQLCLFIYSFIVEWSGILTLAILFPEYSFIFHVYSFYLLFQVLRNAVCHSGLDVGRSFPNTSLWCLVANAWPTLDEYLLFYV